MTQGRVLLSLSVLHNTHKTSTCPGMKTHNTAQGRTGCPGLSCDGVLGMWVEAISVDPWSGTIKSYWCSWGVGTSPALPACPCSLGHTANRPDGQSWPHSLSRSFPACRVPPLLGALDPQLTKPLSPAATISPLSRLLERLPRFHSHQLSTLPPPTADHPWGRCWRPPHPAVVPMLLTCPLGELAAPCGAAHRHHAPHDAWQLRQLFSASPPSP